MLRRAGPHPDRHKVLLPGAVRRGNRFPTAGVPRESVINAGATARNFEELLAINSGTFDRLVTSKYILPALEAHNSSHVLLDGGFDPLPLLADSSKRSKEANRRHKEMMKLLANKNTPHRARKEWY